MDESFETFFRERVKDRGFSIKKLSELTGIASAHLENMMRGNFEDIPSAPYFHGYMVRLGKALDFDGEDWWEKVKKEGLVKNSGPMDALPHNRFVRQSPGKLIGIGAVAILIVAYLLFQLSHAWGKPLVTLSSPDQSPYTTQSDTITLEGTVRNADSLYLNGLNGASGDEITIAPDGTWQKGVLLQDGLNTFEISAKKLLGGETDIMEQVIYQAPAGMPSPLTPPSTSPNAPITPTNTAPSGPTSGTLP